MTEFDLIVIGAGPGGYETAAEAAKAGQKVLIVERDKPGGTCLNRGCIPTKALCRSAGLLLDIADSAGLGIDCDTTVRNSFPSAIERKDRIVTALREGVMTELKDATYLNEEAAFVEPHVIEAGGERYTAPKIIIATGSRPAALPIPGAELAMDSTALLDATTLPESIVIIGGGVIGVEFASILAAFGCRVTILEYCKEILPAFDRDVAKRLRMALKRRGINIITSASVTAISPGVKVHYTAKGRESAIEAEAVLMAVGRRPVIPPGLEALGIATERGAIVVDSTMQTSIPGVYAVGDVNGLCMLAHAATAQGRVALGLEQPLAPVPSAVFTHPECAAVGLTEEECQQRELNFTTGQATFRANGKAMAMGATDGMVKVIIDADSKQLLGCHICGPHAADLIAEPALAISARLEAGALARTIHAHPTLSEAVHSAITAALA